MNRLRLYQQTEPPQRDFGSCYFEFQIRRRNSQVVRRCFTRQKVKDRTRPDTKVFFNESVNLSETARAERHRSRVRILDRVPHFVPEARFETLQTTNKTREAVGCCRRLYTITSGNSERLLFAFYRKFGNSLFDRFLFSYRPGRRFC
jgi:hypothetical protein